MKTARPSSVGKNSVASTQDGPSPGKARPRSRTIAAIINASTSNAADDSDSNGDVSNFTVVKTDNNGSQRFSRFDIPDQHAKSWNTTLAELCVLNTVARNDNTQAAENFALSTT